MPNDALQGNGAPETPSAQMPTRRPRIEVQSEIPVLDTGMFDQMMRIAKVMASSKLVPTHLIASRANKDSPWIAFTDEEAIANCFLVVNQAVSWNMDPFQVAQGTYVERGKIGYEGKLLAAVINSHPKMAGQLDYDYDGNPGQQRRVVVKGSLKGENGKQRVVEGTVERWATSNDGWKATKQQDQMLSYRGAREWARRHLPEAIFGVHGDDEVVEIARDDFGPTTIEQRRPAVEMPLALSASAGGEPVPEGLTKVHTTEGGETLAVNTSTGEATQQGQQEQQRGQESQQADPPTGNGTVRANPGMVRILRTKIEAAQGFLKEKALTEAQVAEKFGVKTIEEISVSNINEALSLVQRQADQASGQ